MRRALALAALLSLCLCAWSVAGASALILPPGFQARTLPLPKATPPNWTNGIYKPTTLDFAPDGKLFVAGRNGRVVEFDSLEDSTSTLVLDIAEKVMARGDRGILGMKLDPEYPQKPYIYLSYTYDAPIGGDYTASTHTHLANGDDDCDESGTAADCLVSGRLVRIELDPATSVAVGGVVNPSSEQVLVNSWCQQVTSHSIGDIEFDSEGALLMSGGDGASWGTLDYGQQGNPCGDPPDEGGSLRAQDLRTPETPGDPTDYSGSIIRVNRETGAAMPDNPLSLHPLFANGVEDNRAKRIIAEGLRNPYRFTLRPGTDEIYVGDVGQDRWEEINRFTSPAANFVNFGWPCYEGGSGENLPMPRWQSAETELGKPLCAPLYTNPGSVTPSFFGYWHPKVDGHDGRLFPGDQCDPEPGSAIAGLAFYDPTGIPAENAFPSEYDGSLFFADAARGCVWTISEDGEGNLDPATIKNFAVREESDPFFNPVDIVEWTDGALYMPNFYDDSIVQIRAFPGNEGPTAVLQSPDPTFGPLPLKVELDASGSTDPDGDELTYAWDLDGDDKFDDGSGPVIEEEYTAAVNATPKVRVSDPYNHSDVASLQVFPGDLGPPVADLELPVSSLEWAIGEPVAYAASATDPDGDSFGSQAKPLTAHWDFKLEHCPSACHSHPITSSDTPSGTIVPPSHEYPSHLKLEFTVTDSRGMTDSESVEVYPRLIQVGVRSEPAGIPLSLQGVTSSEPFDTTLIAGGSVSVSAAESATVDGQQLVFDSWSDGGARNHELTSLESKQLVARYRPPEPPPPPGGGPPPAPTPQTATIALASRPAGARLRIGSFQRAAPFSLDFPLQTKTYLLAPAKVKRGARTLVFNAWTKGGRRLGKGRRLPVTISGDARYVAVYKMPRR